MRIIITRNTFFGGRAIEAAPYPVDVLDPVAKQLLALGKAVPAPEPVPSASQPDGGESVSAETPETPAAETSAENAPTSKKAKK